MISKTKLWIRSALLMISFFAFLYSNANGTKNGSIHKPGKAPIVLKDPGKGYKLKLNSKPIIVNSDLDGQNNLFFGPGLLRFGNSKFHYKAWGPYIGYTRLLTQHVGLTIEGGMYWHSAYSISYRLGFLTAGATFLPFGSQGDEESRFTFSVHTLGGISTYNIKQPKASLNTSQNSLALNLGVSEDCLVSDKFKIRIQADYLPTFYNSDVQYSYRLSLGVLWNLQ
ncbi:MAG: hypothetical protein ACJ748_05125 [Flavisolibacter sp.]